jgi:hypothetical protein
MTRNRHLRLFSTFIGCWILAGYLYLIIRFLGYPGIATNPLDPRTYVNPVSFFVLGTLVESLLASSMA